MSFCDVCFYILHKITRALFYVFAEVIRFIEEVGR